MNILQPKRVLLFLFFAVFTLRLSAQENYTIPWDYNDLSFDEFVTKTENQLNIRFLYKEEWVKGLRLGRDPGCRDLACILTSLFKNTDLYFFFDGSRNIIITKGFSATLSNETEQIENSLKPSTEQITKTGELVEIGNSRERNQQGNVTLSGVITNYETGSKLAGVTVYDKNLGIGTNSNKNGFYSLTIPRGFHEIQYSFIGLTEKKIRINLYSSGEINVSLNNSVVPLKEIIVSANKNTTLDRSEVGVEKINKLLPSTLGESDVIKSIVMLPGVQLVGEGSAGFNVRGGSAAQNLILLYGAPIYNSSHFFGFFSSVNSDIIQDITLYKGGIPGRYGGRVSSVLNIESRDGNNKKFGGNLGISPVTTHFMIEGPLKKDALSFILAARSTYSNWIFDIVKNPLIHDKRGSFYDLNGKLTCNLNKNNKLDMSSYISHDYFRFNMNTVYNYDNNILALSWLHFYNSIFSSTVSINNSFYKYNISNQDIIKEAYSLLHKINSTQLKADLNFSKGGHKINSGFDIIKNSVLPGMYYPEGDSSLIIPKSIHRDNAYESAFYIDDKLSITDILSINVGLRISSFFAVGPKTVLSYNPGFSKNRSNISDTINFRTGEITSKYGGPELRVSLNYRISDNNSLKINYNRTRQYLHLISNSISISPTDTWKLSDSYFKPEIGDQYAAGFYQILMNKKIEASAEFYYKEIQNMVDFKGGSALAMVDNIEQYMINVKGKAYGMELSVKKSAGKTRFNISYSYARTFIRSTSEFKEESINSGNWYPANYDRPNNLIFTYQYIFSRRLSFSADYTYSTGRPLTLPIATYRVNNILMVQYSDRNKYRIPDYNRLDASIKISGNLRSDKIANPSLTLSVYNLLGRQNAYSVYFQKENENIKGYKLSVFARPIPSVTFSFDF